MTATSVVIEQPVHRFECLALSVEHECFSAIVGSGYDPDTGDVAGVQLLTPLYRHQDA